MKKFILFLLLAVSTICFGFDMHQYNSQMKNNSAFPQYKFTSVNRCNPCTNYNPHITEVGSIEVYPTEGNYRNGPRRVKVDPNEPFLTPIGDGLYILLFIVGIYIFNIARKRKWKS